MNIKLIPITAYRVEIDDKEIPGEFGIDGPEWNGLTCLKGPNSTKIIASIKSLSAFETVGTIFDNMCGNRGDKSLTGQVVTLSPSLLDKVIDKETNNEPE